MEDQFGFQCCSDLSNLLYITPLYFGKMVRTAATWWIVATTDHGLTSRNNTSILLDIEKHELLQYFQLWTGKFNQFSSITILFCHETSQIRNGTVKSVCLIKKGGLLVWQFGLWSSKLSCPTASLGLEETNAEEQFFFFFFNVQLKANVWKRWH